MRRYASHESIPWYRAPVAWLGVLIFVASLAGCAWIIVTSLQYHDEPLPVSAHSVFGVPARAHSAPTSASSP